MTTPEQILERIYHEKMVSTKPGHIYPDYYPDWVVAAMKEFAVKCCKEQRLICAEHAKTETDTSTSFVYTDIDSNSIINSPLPEILK